MKKTFNVDKELLREAKEACGAKTDTETIRLGLEALVRRAAGERMIAYGGTEPYSPDIPRRRAELTETPEESANRRIA
ncbi:MAG TPA: type II toxin-antitoxin system VapB family antitoxin [Bryobacteraceae bacterium]|nr:type II toxin-antitoxin system VapB family antitoxin [Bryobacteraceae bacterium]